MYRQPVGGVKPQPTAGADILGPGEEWIHGLFDFLKFSLFALELLLYSTEDNPEIELKEVGSVRYPSRAFG